MTDTGADVDKRVAEAWARVEAGLSRVLTASLRQLNAPATVQAIDAAEAALAVPLPQDFRASLRIHNGTDPGPTLPSPDPSTVPLDCLPGRLGGLLNEVAEAQSAHDDELGIPRQPYGEVAEVAVSDLTE